jgi:hypothetical protein
MGYTEHYYWLVSVPKTQQQDEQLLLSNNNLLLDLPLKDIVERGITTRTEDN